MFTITVTEISINHCKSQASKFNLGQRYTANGTPEQQLTGIIGQNVVLNLFDLGDFNGEDGFDNGVDLIFNNLKIDVKTMGRTTAVKPSYTNNFIGLQDYFDPDVYIFCSFNKTNNALTVCGWISKKDFKEKRRFYPKGSVRTRTDGSTFRTFSDLYEIDTVDLNKALSIADLKQQLLII